MLETMFHGGYFDKRLRIETFPYSCYLYSKEVLPVVTTQGEYV